MAEPPTALVPVAILEGEVLPEPLMEFLSALPVVLLGYHELPDQTPPAQARDQFGEQAEANLEDMAAIIEANGGSVETRMAFTTDGDEAIERTAADIERVGIVEPNPVTSIERVLVGVRGGANRPVIADAVATLAASRPELSVTLYHAAGRKGIEANAETALEALEASLQEHGLAGDRIERLVETTKSPIDGLVAAANDHDFLVLGEDRPNITDRVFGETTERVAARALVPVMVVRRTEIPSD